MTDIFGQDLENTKGKYRSCRVAYTINNFQPVISTIIDEEPLFYMDYETGEDDEEFFLEEEELRILESEIETLKSQIQNLERTDRSLNEDPQDLFEDFLDNAMSFGDPIEDKKSAKDLLGKISQSRLAQAYIKLCDDHKVDIVMNDHVAGAFYDRDAEEIQINPNYDEPVQLLSLIRELRRHWQHRQGALINPLTFNPDNAVIINRAQIADLCVSMIRIAWELQLAGEKQAWNYIETSSMADLARAFAREAFADFRTLNNGQAQAAVFESWFLSERCRSQDKIVIKQMLSDYKGYVFDLDEASENITPSLLGAIGSMPYGKNYLAPHVNIILNDPIFTDIRDRSNANFLWFIKFERSFHETEQALQSDFEHAVMGDRPADTYNQNWEEHNEQTQCETAPGASAEIITLFEETGEDITQSSKTNKRKPLSGKKGRKSGNQKDSASIVYLRRWTGDTT